MSTFHRKFTGAFTLVEIMIVVAIIALLAAMALPNFLRARKRAQATVILSALRAIDSAMDQYALETSKGAGATVSWSDVRGYLKVSSGVYSSAGNDLFGSAYVGFTVDTIPRLNVTTFNRLSDATPVEFWSPFYP